MKTKVIYETPQLDVSEVGVESGFAVSTNGIDDPSLVTEGDDYWG